MDSGISLSGTASEYILYPSRPKYKSQHGQFVNNQDYKFNTIIPAGYPLPPNTESGQDLLETSYSSISTADPFLHKYNNNKVQNNFNSLFYTNKLSKEIQKKAEECSKADLFTLIRNQNTNDFMRCGWIYSPPVNPNIPTPQVSQGFLGTKEGPFKFLQPNPPEGEWFWNLNDAQKRILTDRCNALKVCANVGQDSYKFCGYCDATQKGVPVVGQSLIYPNEPGLSCNGRLITSPIQCIQEQPNVQVGANGLMSNGNTPDICSRINGRFSKECILDVIQNNGCSQKGTLYTAIKTSTNSNNYIELIQNSDTFKLYQRSTDPLNEEIISQGRAATKDAIINQIQNLTKNANLPTSPTSALGASARDLCTIQGAIDEYDPCTEIADTATAPYDLVCLQNNFRRLGGQPAGLSYPTSITIANIYNKINNYGEIRTYWKKLINETKSKSYSVQMKAMKEFYGIDLNIDLNDAPSTNRNTGRIIIGESPVGDIGYPHIVYGLSKDILFIRAVSIDQSINKEIDPYLNSNMLLKLINRGRKYTAKVKNNKGNEVTVKINEALSIENNYGQRYALAFRVDKNLLTELNYPDVISVTIFLD